MFISPVKYLSICERYPARCGGCGDTVEIGDVYMYYEGRIFCEGCLEIEEHPDYLRYLAYLKSVGVLDRDD
jgi:hypothetical protein